MKFTKEELTPQLEKYQNLLTGLFGEDYDDRAIEGFNRYLETYKSTGFIAPTREYTLDYLFEAWLQVDFGYER